MTLLSKFICFEKKMDSITPSFFLVIIDAILLSTMWSTGEYADKQSVMCYVDLARGTIRETKRMWRCDDKKNKKVQVH